MNRREEGGKFVARIRQRFPGYTVEDLLRAFHFDAETQRLFRAFARQIDFGAP